MIADETEFAWVLPRLYGDSWLDMTMAGPGVPPKTWNDGTLVSFTNWKDGCPYRCGENIYSKIYSLFIRFFFKFY